MQAKGVIVVPATDRLEGRWLDATHATALQRVANRPIVCHVLAAFAAAGVTEAVLLTPPEIAEEIELCLRAEGTSGVEVAPLVHDYRADPAGAVAALAERVGDAPVIVHRANGLLGQPLAPFLELVADDSPDVVLLVTQGARNTERLAPASQQMLRIVEMDPANAGFGVAGVCVLGSGALRSARAVRWSAEGLELEAMAEDLAEHGGTLQVRMVRSWRAFAGDVGDLLAVNRTVLDALADGANPPETDGNRFEGRVLIDPTASISSSVICGPVIVGAGAHVADSYIGPHTSIGERVRVEGAEIERSIVLAGASIVHVGGRLVASVVGREARIFRDFSVPRAIRLQVGDGDEVALC
ncbi:MAG TPA: NDP-sugar synthase [Solirubrobacteraceae bacterium]|jgi:glucose-1-phosphate thymidylyltransferase